VLSFLHLRAASHVPIPHAGDVPAPCPVQNCWLVGRRTTALMLTPTGCSTAKRRHSRSVPFSLQGVPSSLAGASAQLGRSLITARNVISTS
jgi:hypothetical protein